MLQWARARHCPWDVFTCEAAATGGHLEVLRWAREHDCPWDPQRCRFVAGSNQELLALIQQLGG